MWTAKQDIAVRKSAVFDHAVKSTAENWFLDHRNAFLLINNGIHCNLSLFLELFEQIK